MNLAYLTEQNKKQAQAAKRAKKAEAVVIMETPEETAAFLAKAKGQNEPILTVSLSVIYSIAWYTY